MKWSLAVCLSLSTLWSFILSRPSILKSVNAINAFRTEPQCAASYLSQLATTLNKDCKLPSGRFLGANCQTNLQETSKTLSGLTPVPPLTPNLCLTYEAFKKAVALSKADVGHRLALTPLDANRLQHHHFQSINKDKADEESDSSYEMGALLSTAPSADSTCTVPNCMSESELITDHVIDAADSKKANRLRLLGRRFTHIGIGSYSANGKDYFVEAVGRYPACDYSAISCDIQRQMGWDFLLAEIGVQDPCTDDKQPQGTAPAKCPEGRSPSLEENFVNPCVECHFKPHPTTSFCYAKCNSGFKTNYTTFESADGSPETKGCSCKCDKNCSNNSNSDSNNTKPDNGGKCNSTVIIEVEKQKFEINCQGPFMISSEYWLYIAWDTKPIKDKTYLLPLVNEYAKKSISALNTNDKDFTDLATPINAFDGVEDNRMYYVLKNDSKALALKNIQISFKTLLSVGTALGLVDAFSSCYNNYKIFDYHGAERWYYDNTKFQNILDLIVVACGEHPEKGVELYGLRAVISGQFKKKTPPTADELARLYKATLAMAYKRVLALN